MPEPGFGAGKGQRASRRSRSLPLRSRITLACAMLSVTGSLVTMKWAPRPLLVWNASASSPTGLYRIGQSSRIQAGAMVVAWPPAKARRLGAERHYLPGNVPLVKRVAAAQGDRACALQNKLFVNGRLAARRRATDSAGRPMPWWTGCEVIERGDLLLLMNGNPDSFDGRYFGITRRAQILGSATLIWPL